MKKKFTSALILVLFSHIAQAATDAIQCSGKVEQIAVYSSDTIVMRLSSMNYPVTICSLSSTVGSTMPVPPSQCKAAYAALMLAMAQDKTASVWLDNVVNGTNCQNFSRLEMATIRWVELTRQ
jgi:hypothetical protein